MRVKAQNKKSSHDAKANKKATRKAPENNATMMSFIHLTTTTKPINDEPLRESIVQSLNYQANAIKKDGVLKLDGLKLKEDDIVKIRRKYKDEGIHISNLIIRGDKLACEVIQSAFMWNALSRLNLENCDITCDLCLPFSYNSTIKELNLGYNDISCDGAELLSKNTSISKLVLNHNRIGNRGAQSLARNTTIRELDLAHNKVKDAGAMALATSNTLKKLYLPYNVGITDYSAEAFSKNSSIRELSLRSTKITHVGAHYLSKNNKKLGLLDLCDCDCIGDIGAVELAKMHSLHKLYVDCCNISDEGCEALSRNPTIEHLVLCFNKIQPHSAKMLLKKKNLYELWIQANYNLESIITDEEFMRNRCLMNLRISASRGYGDPTHVLLERNRRTFIYNTKKNLMTLTRILPSRVVINFVAHYVELDPVVGETAYKFAENSIKNTSSSSI